MVGLLKPKINILEMGKIFRVDRKSLSMALAEGQVLLRYNLPNTLGRRLTGVCNTTNLELVQSLGAAKVIDYTKEDFTKSGQTYDIIFDAVAKNSFSNCKKSSNPKGVYLSTFDTLPLLLQMLWTSKVGSKKAMSMESLAA